jgi:E3 ubiquitin-protein ligase HUWE1
MDFARVFLENHDTDWWPEFTQDAKDALSVFWASRDRNSEVFVFTFIAMNPIVFPEQRSEFCDDLEHARAIVDRIDHAHRKYRRLAKGILISLCPQFASLEDRAANLIVRTTRYLHLEVPREQLLEIAVEWFEAHTGEEIRESGVSIYFQDEYGSDAGGLRREWFYLLGQAIADDTNGILVETESHRLAPSAVADNSMEFVGKFVAKSIVAGHRVPIRFTKFLLRYILEGLDSVSLDLDMYKEDHRVHATSLIWIMNNDPSSEGWERATQDLSFSVDLVHDGHHSVHELIEGGATIPVTDENKADYVQRVIEYKLRQSIRPKLESFLTGFYSVLPRERLEGGFTADELDTVIAGDLEIDVADLKANTQYIGYTATDQQVVWFWEMVEEFDQEDISLLVKFTSGTALAPVGGFASLPFKIARVGLHENPANNPLPSAHTCYNQLDLPAYTSKEELRDKLVRSMILGSEGFGFA